MISLLKILNELEINKPNNLKNKGYIYYPEIKTWILWDEDSDKTSSTDNEGWGCKVWGNDPQNNEYYAFFFKYYLDDEGNHITEDEWEEIGEYDLTDYENSELVELIFLGKGNSNNIVLFNGGSWNQKLNELEINKPNNLTDLTVKLLLKLIFVNSLVSRDLVKLFRSKGFYNYNIKMEEWLMHQKQSIQKEIYQELLKIQEKYNIS